MKFGIYTLVDEDGKGDKPFTQLNDILASRGVLSLFKTMGRFTKLTLKKIGIYDNCACTVETVEPYVVDVDEVVYLDSLEHPDDYKNMDIVVPEKYTQKAIEESEEN